MGLYTAEENGEIFFRNDCYVGEQISQHKYKSAHV